MWQDIVLASAGLLFGIVLIPQIRDLYHGGPPLNLTSASLTVVALMMINYTYVSLGLWYSVMANIVDVAAWGLIVGFSISNREVTNERV